MCSFGSCQTRFEFLSQFRKVRNAFECFVTQVQTHLPKTKRVWPMKINVICTVVKVHHCWVSGKQSSQAMQELQEETGMGPGNTGLLVGRHRPIAAM